MRVPAVLAAFACISVGSPAAAEVPYPTVDYQGEWVLSGESGQVMRAGMRYSASQKRMRMEMNQQGMAMTSVQDIAGGQAIMWSEQMPGMAMRIAIGNVEEFNPERTDETRTIEGETCTVWVVAEARACLTEENIPIETSGEGFTAVLQNLERTSQDAALFEPPSGLQVMDMPAGMPGGGDMMPRGLPF